MEEEGDDARQGDATVLGVCDTAGCKGGASVECQVCDSLMMAQRVFCRYELVRRNRLKNTYKHV